MACAVSQAPDEDAVQRTTPIRTKNDAFRTSLVGGQGGRLVGFMGAPGQALAAFVENGFTGSVKATWKIDGVGSYVSEGDVADYSGWHEFYGLPKDILTNAKKGKQMTISDSGGKTITLTLATASDPFSQFMQCFGK